MNRKVFFAELKKTLYKGGLSQSAVNALEMILDETVGKGIPSAHVAYMMATAYHESGKDLQPKVENLNYTTAARIKAVWPTRFANAAAAQPYVKNPQKLANFVYGGRLGNTGPNDGWLYRGRGNVQITGKTNYSKMKKYIGKDAVANPDIMLELKNSIIALVHCMIDGVYTGKKLSDYNLPSQYFDARAIINADKNRVEGGKKIGNTIADYAKTFEAALNAAGFTKATTVVKKPDPTPTPVESENKTPIEQAADGTPAWVKFLMGIFEMFFSSKGK